VRYFAMLTAALCSICSHAFAGEPPHSIKPLMEWSGNDSKQPTQELAICRAQEQWEANWKKHGGNPANCPRFDFDTQMMVVFFRGKSGEDAFVLSEVLEEGEQSHLRFTPICHQVGEPQDANLPINDSTSEPKKSPRDVTDNRPCLFDFVLLPKSSKTISIEENVQTELGKPPIWREQHRFPAITHLGSDAKKSQKDSRPRAQPKVSNTAKALHRAEGLILLLILRPGMTTAQVDQVTRVFGGFDATNFQGFANSSFPSFYCFDDEIHGLHMGYKDNNDGVFRLNSIRLLPIEQGK